MSSPTQQRIIRVPTLSLRVLPHPEPLRGVTAQRNESKRVRRGLQRVGRDDDVLHEVHGHADVLLRAAHDAALEHLPHERAEHHQAELHLRVRRAVRRVHERVADAHEVVERDAEPHVRDDLVGVLAVDLLHQHLRVVGVEQLRRHGNHVRDAPSTVVLHSRSTQISKMETDTAGTSSYISPGRRAGRTPERSSMQYPRTRVSPYPQRVRTPVRLSPSVPSQQARSPSIPLQPAHSPLRYSPTEHNPEEQQQKLTLVVQPIVKPTIGQRDFSGVTLDGITVSGVSFSEIITSLFEQLRAQTKGRAVKTDDMWSLQPAVVEEWPRLMQFRFKRHGVESTKSEEAWALNIVLIFPPASSACSFRLAPTLHSLRVENYLPNYFWYRAVGVSGKVDAGVVVKAGAGVGGVNAKVGAAVGAKIGGTGVKAGANAGATVSIGGAKPNTDEKTGSGYSNGMSPAVSRKATQTAAQAAGKASVYRNLRA
ncbi:hypothetical protein ON010_g3840 [Phytophthora cinnamomi]|nr:hypothetical protein ON010_g3840 [Phytophthora cinnamomi]